MRRAFDAAWRPAALFKFYCRLWHHRACHHFHLQTELPALFARAYAPIFWKQSRRQIQPHDS